MKSSTLITEKQREFFSKDFFGKLIVETTPEKSRAYFPDQRPSDVEWEPWELVSESGGEIKTRTYENGEWKEHTLLVEGDCYRVEQPQFGFGEWFCRLNWREI